MQYSQYCTEKGKKNLSGICTAKASPSVCLMFRRCACNIQKRPEMVEMRFDFSPVAGNINCKHFQMQEIIMLKSSFPHYLSESHF